MKRNSLFATILLLAMLFLQSGAQSAQAAEDGPLDFPTPLCAPDAYLYDPHDCLPLGPSQTLTELAAAGVRYPQPPLAYTLTPEEYGWVDSSYIEVLTEGAISIYNSLDAAISFSTGRIMPDGFRYFSYFQRAEPEGSVYYQVKTGEWVWGGDVRRITPPRHRGMAFLETPKNDFAFVIEMDTPAYQGPDYNAGLSGNRYQRFQITPLYGEALGPDGTLWYRVGLTDWLPKRTIAAVHINTTPPEGVDNKRWIEVDLYQQVLKVYENGELKFVTLVSTGVEPFWTQPGLFQIYKRVENEVMTTSDPSDYYYLEDVPWTQYYDDARALHGIYWHPWLGYNNSHGCVNLSIADARWLWDWAQMGDYVYVWDPSGETPTDPSFYTGGGGY
jgi:lipoprotein-anchoring transpeptidase ErfK/SrfK